MSYIKDWNKKGPSLSSLESKNNIAWLTREEEVGREREAFLSKKNEPKSLLHGLQGLWLKSWGFWDENTSNIISLTANLLLLIMSANLYYMLRLVFRDGIF